MNSSNGSCSRTGSELVRGSPSVKAVIMDGPVTKELPDADGHLIEETPCSRTGSELVRGSPSVKAVIMDGPVTKELPDAEGHLIEETPYSRTGSELVRGSPSVKAVIMDGPVSKELPDADGHLIEETPSRTRSGLVRQRPILKASSRVESVTVQHDGLLKEDEPLGTRSGLVRGSFPVKALGKDESVTEGLPDGWLKEYRPRKPGSSQKNDPYYIDPVSGYEFRSLKDVYRYLRTGDIRQCAMRPKQGTLYDVCITESQTNTRISSQQTRPGTADKAIQCEILTSEGIMLPWEELFSPDTGKNKEHTMSQESEIIKTMERCVDKLETSQQNGFELFPAQCAPRQTESIKRKKQSVEVKSKKDRSEASPAVTPIRVSCRLAALNAQSEASSEPKDQLISVNPVNQLQMTEENKNCMSETSQSSTMNKIHGNEERTSNQIWSSQDVTVNITPAMQENTTNHLQLSQVDYVSHKQLNQQNIRANQENTGHQLRSSLVDTDIAVRTVHRYSTDQPSQAETMNHELTNMENAFDQLESLLADTLNHIEASQEKQFPNGGVLVTDFWRSFENQDSSVPMQIDGVPIASFPANVKFQTSDQSGLAIPSLFGNAWSDPCIEFAFKTLTGDIPVLDDTCAVTDYFPQQQDLNKGTTPNCTSSAIDDSRTHTQIDVNLPLPRPSDKLHNGSCFPPE
ncbi:hypothetical protein PR202_gb25640 [Eleusine coracana subsp. coracana]|uniref:MBD domain-containing protein n=1 Tax=Eleusine coracana subsp. coracana TaxID=191504 RepID=A0AAV5FP39_ELECO|nr:hypothetical protein PR202_gb25640 [Eleusine coracana subsp. coracana]